MFIQYFKQAFYLMKENKLLSFISIAGTAFAITMIMVQVITIRSQIASFPPETNRERSLVFQWAGLQSLRNEHWQSNGPISYKTAKECFKELTTAEAVTVYAMKETMLASQPVGKKVSCDVQQTDDVFWKVFDFSFINGKSYNEEEFEAGITKAVICESVARKVFGTVEATGKTILLNHAEYTVCGVVKDVSMLAQRAYAQVWIPMSSTGKINEAWGSDGTMGSMNVVILAHSKDDFPAIREEAERLRQKYVASLDKQDILYRGQPDTYFVAVHRGSANNPSRAKDIKRQYIITLLVLLIVPAINLSGMTLSRMRKRLSEIGLRKAFGASRRELMIQILSENLLYSLFGGLLGLLLSYLSAYLMSDFLFGSGWTSSLRGVNNVSLTFLLNPTIFLLAFLFCLMLNLLSAGIPAWRTAQRNITESLNER